MIAMLAERAIMQKTGFYFTYAFRNLQRGGRWTSLAILCIVAGVATVVALRGLGLAIGDSLIENVRIENKGDIQINRNDSAFLGFDFDPEPETFTPEQIAQVQAWVDERGGQMAAFRIGSARQIAPVGATTVGQLQFISSFFIDPDVYPLTHDIVALDPAGATLDTLFTTPFDIVISQNLAQQNNIKVGDAVRVSGTDDPYTVRGIVPTEAEAGLRNIFGAFFGFVYFDLEQTAPLLETDSSPTRITITLPQPISDEELAQAVSELPFRQGSITTTADILELNAGISQVLGDFIVVLGLGALLIGGVGILNTMLVMVRRRTNEIAAMKTFGLFGGQVAIIFFLEALLLGFLGSLIGMVIGVLLGGVVNQFGAIALQQSVPWRIYPEALFYGFALGMLTTAVFGVAPILTAIKIRPGIILRPNETQYPSLGVLQSGLLLVFITVSLGLIVGQIISPTFTLVDDAINRPLVPSPYVVGIIGTALTFVVLGLVTMSLWVTIWFIGRLPAFGSVNLQLALRNLSTNRLRSAVTLLALSAGMFALSVITFVGQGTREFLSFQLSQQFGGNVLAFPLLPGALGEVAVNSALANVEGVQGRTIIMNYNTRLVALNGVPFEQQAFRDQAELRFGPPADVLWDNLTGIETTNTGFFEQIQVVRGRMLTPADSGQTVMVGPAETAALLGLDVGSTITYESGGARYTFEIVGLTDGSQPGSVGATPIIPPGVLGGSLFQIYAFDVAPENTTDALLALSRIPLVFVLDVGFLDSFIGRIITQFTAIPTIVGILSLISAAVIMANTIALATLERQRQIGILKAVGLKGRRVLTIMLIEASIIGVLSALIGIGMSSLIISTATSLGGFTIPLPRDARVVTVLLLGAGVLIGWVATFLSARTVLEERVMNVLRYE
jgi:putative ABC transport system permease protein